MTAPKDQPPPFQALSLEHLSKLKPRPGRGVNRIEINSDPVRVRGEELHEVWWRGKQWAVTAFGIECLDGTYFAPAADLAKELQPWPLHMASKTWVDIDEFTTAWMVALLLHGQASQVDPAAVREMFGKLRPRNHEEADD